MAEGNGKELATIRYEPNAPVGGGLKALMQTQAKSIQAMLPKHITPERLFKTMLVAANRNPTLLECTQASILETINRAAELGLDLSGTLGEAYPVPYRNKGVMQCQLIIGYRGLEKLAWQSGEVASIDAEVVCERDHFVFSKGIKPQLEWRPAMDGDRGKPIGAYAMVLIKGSEVPLMRFMPTSDIEKIRAKATSGNSPAWKEHWSEMARKTALRRVMKDAPLSTEKFVAAMEHEDRDFTEIDVLAVEPIERGNAGLRNRLAGGDDAVEGEATEKGGDAPDSVALPTVGKVIHGIIEAKTGIKDSEQRSGIIERWASAKDIPTDDLALVSDGSEKPTAIIEMAKSLKSWELYIRRD